MVIGLCLAISVTRVIEGALVGQVLGSSLFPFGICGAQRGGGDSARPRKRACGPLGHSPECGLDTAPGTAMAWRLTLTGEG
jgi:hypothetical protein